LLLLCATTRLACLIMRQPRQAPRAPSSAHDPTYAPVAGIRHGSLHQLVNVLLDRFRPSASARKNGGPFSSRIRPPSPTQGVALLRARRAYRTPFALSSDARGGVFLPASALQFVPIAV
jgi:hypothetical protein